MRRFRVQLALVLAAAVVARLSVYLAFPNVFDFVRTGQVHGSEAYDTYAVNLLQTGEFGREPGKPDAMIPPLYAYALAGAYALMGRGSLQVLLFHTVLDVLSIALLADIGRRLFPRGQWVGLGAALAAGLYPYLLFQTASVIDTSVCVFLLHTIVWLMLFLRRPDPTRAGFVAMSALAGLAVGLAWLVRPTGAVFGILAGLWLTFNLGLRRALIRLMPATVIALLIAAAWAWRNYGVYRTFVPSTTTAGSNFWQGNNALTVPVLQAGYDVQWTAPGRLMAVDLQSPDADAERFALGFRYLQEHPGDLPELLATKFLVLWSIEITPRYNPSTSAGPIIAGENGDSVQMPALASSDAVAAYSRPLFDTVGRTVHRWYWGSLLAAALLGLVISLRDWREVSLIWTFQVATTIAYLAYHPATRYRVPTDPLLFLFSASALVWAALRIARRGPTVAAAPYDEQCPAPIAP